MRPTLGHTLACPGARDFWRCAQWSPDGSLILARSDSHRVHIWAEQNHTWSLLHTHQAPAPILDTGWYALPAHTASDPAWCYAISCRDMPVRLVDAQLGQTKASYAIVNHIEAYVAPHVLAFTPDAMRLYGGLSTGLAMIPLACVGTNTHSALCLDTSRSHVRQRGIVSALALGHAPDMVERDLQSDQLEVTAVGTFANTVGIYLTEPSWLAALEEQGSAWHSPMLGTSCALPGEALCLCGWHVAEGQGVIQLAWHPRQRHILVVSLRKSQQLLVYDTSYLYGMSRPQAFRTLAAHEPALVAMLERDCTATHQRLYFDMDRQGHWMAAGDEHGTVRIWSWSDVLTSKEPTVPVTPTVQWQAHTDAVGSVQFHPQHTRYLLTVGGARHWPEANEPYPLDNTGKVWDLPQLEGSGKDQWQTT